MICPKCGGTITSNDGKYALCRKCGVGYEILFSRFPPIDQQISSQNDPIADARAEKVQTIPEPMARGEFEYGSSLCQAHPNVKAIACCAICGVFVCPTCEFLLNDGTSFCIRCYQNKLKSAGSASQLPGIIAQSQCFFHPAMKASSRCASCQVPICSTCDYKVAGGLHVCPNCASGVGKKGLSTKRRGRVVFSYIFAVLSTLFLVGIFAGGYTEGISEAAARLFGTALLGTAIAGTAFGLTAIDRHLYTPIWFWVAAGWNIMILMVMLALSLIGAFMGG
jgi:hypothetical protein